MSQTKTDYIELKNVPDAAAGIKGVIQLSGDLGGTAVSPTVSKVNGVSISGTPTVGQVPTATSGVAATWQSTSDTTVNGVTVSGSPLTSYVLTATGGATANWQPSAGGGGGSLAEFLQTFTATGGQTVFGPLTGAQIFTPGGINAQVFRNGQMLVFGAGPADGYTESGNTTIVLNTAQSAGDIISVRIESATGPAAVTGTGTAGKITKWASSTALADSVMTELSSSIGLSTATPLSKLDVNGGLAVGSYAGTTASPANGAIISGVVGVGTSAPHASAAAEVASTTKGFLPPRMTTAQRIAISSPAPGLVVFDTDTLSLHLFT